MIHMAIKAARRRRLKKRQFGLPGQRKYPLDTKGRARNAKGRATQQYKRGRISKSTRDRIHARANRALRRKRRRGRRR